jgi:hypothetical protein
MRFVGTKKPQIDWDFYTSTFNDSDIAAVKHC